MYPGDAIAGRGHVGVFVNDAHVEVPSCDCAASFGWVIQRMHETGSFVGRYCMQQPEGDFYNACGIPNRDEAIGRDGVWVGLPCASMADDYRRPLLDGAAGERA